MPNEPLSDEELAKLERVSLGKMAPAKWAQYRRVLAELRFLRGQRGNDGLWCSNVGEHDALLRLRLAPAAAAAVEAWRALSEAERAHVLVSLTMARDEAADVGVESASHAVAMRLLEAQAPPAETPAAAAAVETPAAEHHCARCHAVMVHNAEVEGREGVEWWCTGCEYVEPAAKPAKCSTSNCDNNATRTEPMVWCDECWRGSQVDDTRPIVHHEAIRDYDSDGPRCGANGRERSSTDWAAVTCPGCLRYRFPAQPPPPAAEPDPPAETPAAEQCVCRSIQQDDPRRHFQGCPLRKPLDAEPPPPAEGHTCDPGLPGLGCYACTQEAAEPPPPAAEPVPDPYAHPRWEQERAGHRWATASDWQDGMLRFCSVCGVDDQGAESLRPCKPPPPAPAPKPREAEPFDVVDAAQALETMCVTRAENDEEQRLTYEHACDVTAAVARLQRELDTLATEVGSAIVLCTVQHDESAPVQPHERALSGAVRDLLTERNRLHSMHEDEKAWRIDAEKERDRTAAIVAAARRVAKATWDSNELWTALRELRTKTETE